MASSYFEYIADLTDACKSFTSEPVKIQILQVFEIVTFTAHVSSANTIQILKRDSTAIIGDLDPKIGDVYSHRDAGRSSI